MVIVDTSVVYKWYSLEENSDQARVVLKNHLNGQEIICAPELILYELTNAWVTKTGLTLSQIKKNFKNFKDDNILLEGLSYEIISKALELAKKYKITIYDASYITLAKQKKCLFITADQKLIEKVNLPFVKLLKDYVV